MEMNNPLLIVIDPGHGGDDYGAMWNGRLEKDDNLRLGLAVRDALMYQGIDVLMTRDTDVFIPLADRAAMANDADADLFVALHRNSYTEQTPTSNGIENIIYLTAPANTTGVAAQKVLDAVVAVGAQSNRGVTRGNYYVLRRTRMPAMLLEMGFIIDDYDNQLFDQNLEAYAQAIAKGVMDYFGLTYQAPNTQPPVVQPVPPIGQPLPPVGTLPPAQQAPPVINPLPPSCTLQTVCTPTAPKPPVQPVPPIGTLPTCPPPTGTFPSFPESTPPAGTFPSFPEATLPESTAPSPRTDLVIEAQRALNSYFGANLTLDGVFGTATKQSVIQALQQQINSTRNASLVLDGLLGPETMALLPTLRQGDHSNLVVLLQIMLGLRGYDTGGITGTFDAATRTAVELFQRDHYLIPDGVAGPRTIACLLT